MMKSRSIKRMTLGLMLTLLLSLSSCAFRKPVILLVVPENLKEEAAALLADFPYGESLIYELSEEDRRPVVAQMELIQIDWENQRDISEAYSVLLDKTWYAPAVPFLEYHQAPPEEMPALMPLEEIQLPQRALPVEGLYPGEEEYPYVSERILTLSGDLSHKRFPFPELEPWFLSLDKEFPEPDVQKIALVGDILPARGVEGYLAREDGLQIIFKDTLPILQGADLTLGNLEGAVTTRGQRVDKSFNFRFHPNLLDPLKEAGFDYFSLTNNHIFDYGLTGFKDTLTHLKEKEIGFSGAGLTPEEATALWQTTLEGQRINVLSLGAYPRENNGFDGKVQTAVSEEKPGVLWQGDWALDQIEEAFSEPGFNIIMVHGGREWANHPVEYQKELYRKLIDRGADLVAGHHPHVLQGVQEYNHGLIHYSLGNFLFPGMFLTTYGEESMILQVGIYQERILYMDLIPVQMNNLTLSLDKEGKILDRFLPLSRRLNPEE